MDQAYGYSWSLWFLKAHTGHGARSQQAQALSILQVLAWVSLLQGVRSSLGQVGSRCGDVTGLT